MATALQQQLAAIAADSTHQLDLRSQKAGHSKSLLFEPREAGSQSFDTIYQICIEAFEELCLLDKRYEPFSRTLFSEQSKNEDRTRMTAAETHELDRVIERFLGLLSSRLLLTPAIKVAEWLVRRFRVHEYNTAATLMAFLPYHATPIFATLLSILPNQVPPIFRFLLPYIASVQPLPRHVIVSAAGSNHAFLAAFSQFVIGIARAGHQSAALLGFWASVTAQAVNSMIDGAKSGRESIRRQKEEDVLLRILPILQSTLSIKGVSELYLASCMIMTIIVTKMQLEDKVVDAMMQEVVDGWARDTVQDGLTCLAVLAEEKELIQIPRSVTRTILDTEGILAYIQHISVRCRVDRISAGIALAMLSSDSERPKQGFSDFLLWAWDTGVLSENSTKTILEAMITEAMRPADQQLSRNTKSQILELLEIFETSSAHNGRYLRDIATQLGCGLKSLGLQPVIDSTNNASAATDQDDASRSLQESDDLEANSFDLDIAGLPSISEDSSFLDSTSSFAFSQYAECFKMLVLSKSDSTPLLDRISGQKGDLLLSLSSSTFLVRLWSSDLPAPVRSRAMHLVANELKRANEHADATVDFQAFIPYLSIALADPSRTVRKAAFAVCIALKATYSKSSSEKKATKSLPMWGKNSLYGHKTSALHWASLDSAASFVTEALCPVGEDCILDKEFATTAIAGVLNGKTSNGPRSKELKSSLRTDLTELLVSHAVHSPAPSITIGLLNILNKLGKVAVSARTRILLPFITPTLTQAPLDGKTSDTDLQAALIRSITHRTAGEIQLVKDIVDGTLRTSNASREVALSQLRKIWAALDEPSQISVFDWLASLALDTTAVDVASSGASDLLKTITLPRAVLVHMVETLPNVSDVQSASTPIKKSRTGRLSDVHKYGGVDETRFKTAVKRFTLVLELVEESHPGKHPQLMKGLFHVLGELHHFKILVGSELVYLQGLVINSLLAIANSLQDAAEQHIDRSVIRADLIVECARTTAGTQVHHSALLLMSALASRLPDLVLHSVMPLFTFMSSSILKQSDEYSARVTERTVACIIPPLIRSFKKKGKDLITGSSELLLSFIAAFEHVPLHRRSGLFKHLILTLGPEESLFAVVAMLVERYPGDPRAIPFVQELMSSFSTSIQLHAMNQYSALVFDTLKQKRDLADTILGFNDKSSTQAQEATSYLLRGQADILSNGSLRKKILKELKIGEKAAETIKASYAELLHKVMQLNLQLADNSDLYSAADKVLSALLGLMPTEEFIDSSARLMQSGTDEIRQQVFRSLEARIHLAHRGDVNQQRIFLDVLPNCVVFLNANQSIATRFAAINCIDEISEKFGKTDRAAVMSAAQHVAGESALGSHDRSLRVTSLLCLASMVDVLEEEIVPILPAVLNQGLDHLELNIKDGDIDEELVNATFSLASAVLDRIAWMISGKPFDRLLNISERLAILGVTTRNPIAERFCILAAKKVAVKECLSAIERSWVSEAKSQHRAASLRLEMLRTVVQLNTKAEISKNTPKIFSILLSAFDFRRTANVGLDTSDSHEQDDALDLVNKAAMDVVLKSSDAIFRPFFIQLTEWAIELANQNPLGYIRRSASLYSFALTFFNQLQSLVTNYGALLMENAANQLSSLSSKSEQEHDLLILVLQALDSCFKHDQDGFWQVPAHFDAVAQPLLALLSRNNAGSLHQNAIDAIRDLTAASSSPDHYKTINSALMKLMRHQSAPIRLAAVKCERAISEKLNLDWIALLPEMLPAISELQEDDDADVERETLQWVQQIEGITGESMEGMLQ